MDHTVEAKGFGVRLRPVRMDDAAFIVWLRNLEHAKGRVGDSAADVAGQENWLKKYFQRDGDYYFIIETQGGMAVGTYGLYDLKGTSAESGRWIVNPDAPAAIPSAVLAFDLAFEKLGLNELRASTVATNQSVLSLNREFGFRQTGVVTAAQVIGGHPVDLLHFSLSAKDWRIKREYLLPMAQLAERLMKEWERAQSEH
jgi:RimJ/RimL family protein N-acetyltransferase